MAEEIVRVMRLIIYEGPREWVENTIIGSISGTKVIKARQNINGKITAVTLNEFPEIIKQHENNSKENLNDYTIANKHLIEK